MTTRMSISDPNISLIKKFEGFRAHAIQIDENTWVVGYGHKLSHARNAIMSETEANQLLRSDLEVLAEHINDLIFAPLTQNQFDALLSLAFNIGLEAFRTSRVLACVNSSQILQAARYFAEWSQAKFGEHVVSVDALVRRRAQEVALFLDNDFQNVAPTGLIVPIASGSTDTELTTDIVNPLIPAKSIQNPEGERAKLAILDALERDEQNDSAFGKNIRNKTINRLNDDVPNNIEQDIERMANRIEVEPDSSENIEPDNVEKDDMQTHIEANSDIDTGSTETDNQLKNRSQDPDKNSLPPPLNESAPDTKNANESSLEFKNHSFAEDKDISDQPVTSGDSLQSRALETPVNADLSVLSEQIVTKADESQIETTTDSNIRLSDPDRPDENNLGVIIGFPSLTVSRFDDDIHVPPLGEEKALQNTPVTPPAFPDSDDIKHPIRPNPSNIRTDLLQSRYRAPSGVDFTDTTDPSSCGINSPNDKDFEYVRYDNKVDNDSVTMPAKPITPFSLLAILSAAIMGWGLYDSWDLLMLPGRSVSEQIIAGPFLMLMGAVGLMIGFYYLLRGLIDRGR